jgi:hypothetical protein
VVRQSVHGQALISSGLGVGGEQVVTDGQYGLTPGVRVAVQPSGLSQGNSGPAGPMRNAQTNRLGISP